MNCGRDVVKSTNWRMQIQHSEIIDIGGSAVDLGKVTHRPSSGYDCKGKLMSYHEHGCFLHVWELC